MTKVPSVAEGGGAETAAYFKVVRLAHRRTVSSVLVAIKLAMRVTLNDVPHVTRPDVKSAFAAFFFFLGGGWRGVWSCGKDMIQWRIKCECQLESEPRLLFSEPPFDTLGFRNKSW